MIRAHLIEDYHYTVVVTVDKESLARSGDGVRARDGEALGVLVAGIERKVKGAFEGLRRFEGQRFEVAVLVDSFRPMARVDRADEGLPVLIQDGYYLVFVLNEDVSAEEANANAFAVGKALYACMGDFGGKLRAVGLVAARVEVIAQGAVVRRVVVY